MVGPLVQALNKVKRSLVSGRRSLEFDKMSTSARVLKLVRDECEWRVTLALRLRQRDLEAETRVHNPTVIGSTRREQVRRSLTLLIVPICPYTSARMSLVFQDNYQLLMCNDCVSKLTANSADEITSHPEYLPAPAGASENILSPKYPTEGTFKSEMVDERCFTIKEEEGEAPVSLPRLSPVGAESPITGFFSQENIDGAGRKFGTVLDEVLDATIAMFICGNDDEDMEHRTQSAQAEANAFEDKNLSPNSARTNSTDGASTASMSPFIAPIDVPSRTRRTFSNTSSRSARNSSVNSVEDAYLSALHILHQRDMTARLQTRDERDGGVEGGAATERELFVAGGDEAPIPVMVLEQGATLPQPSEAASDEHSAMTLVVDEEGAAAQKPVKLVAADGSKRRSVQGRLAMVGAGVVGTVLVMTGRSRR